uniref:Gamma-tubulin complex component 6 n=1 Tax=Pavo cristatus TaxID=9049 RepID=A0A8C9FZ67_PAVCR
MESITQLFNDLCEAHLTGLPWKVHLGRRKISKRKAKQNLKRVAYNTLFINLFQDEARKLQSNISRLPVKNKILMLSFNLRVGGLGAQADRLESLVEELEAAEGLPFTEVNAVLDLLVQLAGTGPPQLVPQKKDYFLNNKYVGRNVKYQGYDYYDVSVFEADIQSLITNEECQFNDTIQKTLQIMEAAPGTGLPAIGLFSQNYPAGDKFERETRVSLFGALVHSRTYDMDIKLDLPPVPDNADLSGLAIKVPQSIDQSEDEGFQSASNLTPDSQSEPSMTPDIDLWDAVLTYGPSKRRCWERIGYPPGKKEEPYLTEAGREAFDRFYKLREGEMQLFSSTVLQLPQLVLMREPELVKDVLNVLIGVVSTTFSLNQAAQTFIIKEGVYVSGTSPETMHNLLSEVAEYGTYYTRLSRFSLQPVLDSSYSKGLVFQVAPLLLSEILTYALILFFRYLAELCGIGTTALGISGGAGASFPTGVKLLSYLYKEALNNCSNEHYPVLLSLLKTSCEPYTRFIYDWVYSGVFRDVYGEFMIQVNEDYLCFRGTVCILSYFHLLFVVGWYFQDLRMEIAKQELIVHARETASKVLKAINDRQKSERMALDLANTNADQHFQPKTAGSEGSLQSSEQVCSPLCNADSSPESSVNIEDFLPKPKDEQPVAISLQGSLLDEALRNINSDLSENSQMSENQPVSEGEGNTLLHQQNEYDFSTVLRPTAALQGHIRVGENVFDVESRRPRWNIHGHASDASIRVGEYVPELDTYQPRSSPYGHSSDSHIEISSYTSEVESTRPRWNIHGHVSEAHIKIGEYASEVEPSRPRWSIHGHASEANIRVGEYVSNVSPARPRWNIHGHVSDANIKIGENVSEVVSARPRWNIHGHSSQSHIKIGELVSDTQPLKSRWSPFGHASQSSIQIGKWTPSTEDDPIPHRKAISGPSSDSTVQTLLYNEELSPSEEIRKETKPSQAKETIPQDTVPQETLLSEPSASKTKDEEGGEEDSWKKEQAYLKALSDQYCIEKYQDSYDLMSELPVSHLLHHVIPRSYTFPVDPMVQSATDETAVQLSELLSLPVLMKRSITAPLVSHVSLVNKAIVDYYFVELNVEKHFEALRHFLLMEDGEFAQSLSDLLFEKLGSGQTPGELLNPLVLNSILNKALQYSLHGDTQLASNLSFALKYLPEVFKPNAPDALSCLELRYKVDWPLNIVITESCMNKYNKIFSFLLQLKHMVWTLKDVWFHLKRTALVSHASNSVQFRQLQLYKHEMQHFVKVIQGYIANQILHVTWCEFGNKLSSVGNLEEIHRTHAEYLNKAIFRGLLTEKAAPVMNIIHSIFSLILKFRSQLISQSWSFDAGKQMAVHPNFGLMQQSYNTFKYYSHFLFKVVTKLVNRGYQPHLEDFLLRINFNNYYKDN